MFLFICSEWQEKANIVDREEDDTVSFNFKDTYYFNKEKSQGHSDDEEITVPNFLILGLVNTVLKEKPTFMPVVCTIIRLNFSLS